MYVVYRLQLPPAATLAQLRLALPESVVDFIWRLSWGYVIASWAWFLFYGVILLLLIQLRQGILKYIKCMIIGTPLFNTMLPFVAGVLVAFQIPGSDFWGAVRGAYGRLTLILLAAEYVYAFAWLAYFMLSARVRNTWPNG